MKKTASAPTAPENARHTKEKRMIRTFDIDEDREEVPRVSYDTGTRQIVEGEYWPLEKV